MVTKWPTLAACPAQQPATLLQLPLVVLPVLPLDVVLPVPLDVVLLVQRTAVRLLPLWFPLQLLPPLLLPLLLQKLLRLLPHQQPNRKLTSRLVFVISRPVPAALVTLWLTSSVCGKQSERCS